MNPPPTKARRPLLPLLLLHLAAAGVCFAFFTIVPIVACLVFMIVSGDPGGPLFFPVFVVGVLLCAAGITAALAGSTLLSDLLRRHYRIPVWLPPLTVFVLVTAAGWLLARNVPPALPPLAGGVAALAFTAHWAAISTVWFLPRMLFRLFRVPQPALGVDPVG